MSSRHEVLIRILALLQRKTLIETKNRTLKWHYWTVRSIKNVALLTEDGAFALFFFPHPGGFASSRVPTLGNLPSKAKKMLIPGGQPRGGLGAGGIDWCIIVKIKSANLTTTLFQILVLTFENLKNQGANEDKSVFSLPTDFNRSRSDTGFNSGFW